jgi:hypothetical protein
VQRQLSFDGKVDGSISNYLSEKQQRQITSNKIFAMTDVPVLDTGVDTATHSSSLAVDATKLLKKIKERLDKDAHLGTHCHSPTHSPNHLLTHLITI